MAKLKDSSIVSNFLSNAVDHWNGRIEAARTAKEPFKKVADTCYAFYKKSSGFMWEAPFKDKHLKNVSPPKFSVTIQKAFELVALFGPYLFWQYPYRRVMARERLDIPPELLMDQFVDPNDPNAQMMQMMIQELVQNQQKEDLEAEYRAILMERYLNYSQREQPGGLSSEAQLGIHDALIKGRGCLWPEKYSFPGDDRVLTGMFYDSVDNLFIDPDCNDPKLRTAKWIARRHVTPYWELERRFNLPKDSLKGKAQAESYEAHTTESRKKGHATSERNGKTADLIVWYEVFSKMGIGTRSTEFESENLHETFEENLGDFAYLCITKACNYPLNFPPEIAKKPVEDVVESLSWPYPVYADHSWPVALLDFYPDPDGCWPIAPLGPALGELIAMNIIVSSFLEIAYDNRKQLIAVMEHAADSVDAALKSAQSPAYVKINMDVHQKISECIQFLQRPEMNNDPLKALEWLSMSFDKRTGLSEFLYAMQSTQSRSATDIRSKEEKASIRPEKMSNDVADWISNGSQIEKFIATMFVTGDSLRGLLGTTGSMLWDKLISSQPIDEVAREMTCTIYASDIRKPNKARETENITTIAGYMLPIYQQYATLTGDSEPLNSVIDSIGDAAEIPTKEWRMGPWQPQPDPALLQQQQQLAQLEVAGSEAEVQKKQAEAAKAVAEAEGDTSIRQLEFQFDQAEAESKLSQDAQKHQADMAMSAAEFKQKIIQDQLEFQESMRQKRLEGNERLNQARQQQQIKNAQKSSTGA